MPPEQPTVLVADDETALTDSMAVWLSDDYQVRTAYTGHEAVRAFDSAVDVVLLDRHMPGLSGEDVLKRITERDAEPTVALLTATCSEDLEADGADIGFETVLTKPISKGELLDAVDELAATSSEPARR